MLLISSILLLITVNVFSLFYAQITYTTQFLLLLLLFSSYTIKAGPYWVSLIDSYASGWISMITGIVIPICFGWVYGFERLKNDIRAMLGDKTVDHWTFYYWKVCWMVVSPGIIVVSVTSIQIRIARRGGKN